jgi:hypothetical protein
LIAEDEVCAGIATLLVGRSAEKVFIAKICTEAIKYFGSGFFQLTVTN